MNRRSFLNRLVGGIAATAAVQSWPFRVYSFPTEIVIPDRLFYSAWLRTIYSIDIRFHLNDLSLFRMVHSGIPPMSASDPSLITIVPS